MKRFIVLIFVLSLIVFQGTSSLAQTDGATNEIAPVKDATTDSLTNITDGEGGGGNGSGGGGTQQPSGSDCPACDDVCAGGSFNSPCVYCKASNCP